MSTMEIIMKIVFPFLGGLGLFLYGMHMMSTNLEKTAGAKLRKLLQILTNNKFLGIIVGTLFTMVIQSSSATTVMVVGLVNAGLMTLYQAVGVIMGANIGTTITAQLIAFKLTDIAPAILFAGVVLVFFVKKRSINRIGAVLTGFGLLFMGLAIMSSAMKPLREVAAFTSMIARFENPFLGMLTGAGLTAVIQSSSASIGILQAMANEGLINLNQAIYVLLGQNIGTCITALLACLGSNKTAKRAAMIHFLFNVIGSLLAIGALQIFPITDWIISLSPGSVMRQIANAHTFFNITIVFIMLPFSALLVTLANKLVKGQDPVREPMKLKYIDDNIYSTPAIAVAQVFKEVERMADMARDNLHTAIDAIIAKDTVLVKQIRNREEVLDYLNHEVTRSLVKINQLDVPYEDKLLIGSLFHVVTDLERIGDHADNIADSTEEMIEGNIAFSDKAVEELKIISDKVFNMLDISYTAFSSRDETVAGSMGSLDDEVDDMEKELRLAHINRLNNGDCTPRSSMIFVDLLSNLERVADHSKNIAESVLEEG